MWIPRVILVTSALLLGGGVTTAEPWQSGQPADIAIVFTNPPDSRPSREQYSQYGQFLKRGERTTGAVSFSTVDPDPKGSFADIVRNRISEVTVRWSDAKRLPSQAKTAAFLRELLTTAKSTMHTFHIWSWGDGDPSVVATVSHRDGKHGRWIVWCSPIVYWAYQDGNGLWWWGSADERKNCELSSN
jgi:hypothetical protein